MVSMLRADAKVEFFYFCQDGRMRHCRQVLRYVILTFDRGLNYLKYQYSVLVSVSPQCPPVVFLCATKG